MRKVVDDLADVSGQPRIVTEVPAATPPLDYRTLSPTPSELARAAGGLSREPTATVRIPGYEILGVLGRGGMGIVYKARQEKLQRVVALKMVLAGSFAAPESVRRFLAEAEAVAQLQHPNIVQVYERGECDGRPYFAMEFVADGSLEKMLAGAPLPAAEAGELIEILARAVHHAHEKGIIHRDLKPANVLLQRLGVEKAPRAEAPPRLSSFLPKITDFGLAKNLAAQDITSPGEILGTPCYMAPEQAFGSSKAVGAAADVYALGAMLYEMLTGRPPLRGETVQDTLDQLRVQEPVPPRRLQPRLPRDLETICLKCLEKEPARRYASAAALADDLGLWRRGEPIWARPVGTVERVVKWARRKPALAGLAAASVAALLLLMSSLGLYAVYEAQQADIYRQRLQREQLAKVIYGEKLVAAERQERAEHWAEARAPLAEALAALDAQPDLPVTDLRAEVLQRLAGVERHLQQQEETRQARGRSAEFQRLRGEALFHETLLTGFASTANRDKALNAARAALALYGGAARPGAAREALERARTVLTTDEFAELTSGCYELLLVQAEAEARGPGEAVGPRRQDAEQALQLLAAAAQLGQDYGLESGVYPVRRARYEAQRDGRLTPGAVVPAGVPVLPLDWFLTGLESYRRLRFEDAYWACAEVLERQPRHFWAGYLRALCQLRQGQWSEARDGFTRCLDQRPEFAWSRVLRGFATSELAHVQRNRHQDELARKLFAAARSDFDQAVAAVDPALRYAALVNRGVQGIREGRGAAALADLRAAAEVNPQGYQAYLDLSQAYQVAGDEKRALEALNRAVELAPQLGFLYEARALLKQRQHDVSAAEADFERAAERATGPEALSRVKVELGKLLYQEGQRAKALACYEEAARARPEYALAHRLQAEAFLAMGRHAAAGQALDRYLQLTERPRAEDYLARGLVHAEVREYPAAVEMFTLALHRAPDEVKIHGYRGWVYLRQEAGAPALADFEACLHYDPADVEALCGRGRARALLRQIPAALADADAVFRRGPSSERLGFHLACLYGQLTANLETENAAQDPLHEERLVLCRKRAVQSLKRLLEVLPPERRAAFWHEQIEPEPALASLHRLQDYAELSAPYDRAAR